MYHVMALPDTLSLHTHMEMDNAWKWFLACAHEHWTPKPPHPHTFGCCREGCSRFAKPNLSANLFGSSTAWKRISPLVWFRSAQPFKQTWLGWEAHSSINGRTKPCKRKLKIYFTFLPLQRMTQITLHRVRPLDFDGSTSVPENEVPIALSRVLCPRS